MKSSLKNTRQWRTVFLTLRDETLTSPSPSAVLSLLRRLFLSQSLDAFSAAAASLPTSEVTADVTLLAELGSASSQCDDAAEILLQISNLINTEFQQAASSHHKKISRLSCVFVIPTVGYLIIAVLYLRKANVVLLQARIHDVCCRVRLELNSFSWSAMLTFLELTVENVLARANKKSNLSCPSKLKEISEILEILRLIVKAYGRNSSMSETNHLSKFLIFIISYMHSEMLSMINASGTFFATEKEFAKPKYICLCEIQIMAFSLLDDALVKIGASMSESLWSAVVEVLRKLMDLLASQNLVIVDSIMSRFYTALFHCLHLILADPKGSLSAQVAGFATALQMFLTYGLPSRSFLASTTVESNDKGLNSSNHKSDCEPLKSEHTIYRPPHLRRREGTNMRLPCSDNSSNCEFSRLSLFSSDSEHSDNDVTQLDGDRYRSSKVRAAALLCIQDLCFAEPKSITCLWNLLLPECDVLQPRWHQQTLVSCLLFDPIMKIRIASSSTLAAMLDGHSVVFLQLAEHKESMKCGSFRALSSSLGQILMQLHTGLLHLIKRESHDGFLVSLFKVLVLLITATPYARMPEDLLSTTIASVLARIKEDLAFKTENIGLLAIAISCLGAAFLKSPPSARTLKMLEADTSRGSTSQNEVSAPFILIELSELGRHPAITFEALQALKAMSHNYPSVVTEFWERISAIAYRLLLMPITTDFSKCNVGSWMGDSGKASGATSERCVVAAIKVIDECLRAVSGFMGTDDPFELKLLDIQYMSNTTREKKVGSAPSYDLDVSVSPKKDFTDFSSAVKQWSEVIRKHMPLAICHCTPMVRAAAFSCFTGLTTSLFSMLNEDLKESIISSAISAALNDVAPSAKSSACRVLGILASLLQNVYDGRLLNKFIRAAEFNTHDATVSVRVTASWALANICDSLRHRKIVLKIGVYTDGESGFEMLSLIVETALRLTKDGDKVKSNAVRALGHLSRFLSFNCYSVANKAINSINVCNENGLPVHVDPRWLERMVQAFLSCVTTGNVKVQWNVCYALSNLFMNDTLKLHDTHWAPTVYSILLLLLRDSTNYKIRIHAAVALAVPASRLDYGSSFSDVVQGLEHVLESLGSHHSVVPSSFKYKDNLEKQLSLTTLHVLGFASSEDGPALKDFLFKKAMFFEGWFKFLCSSLLEGQDKASARSADASSAPHFLPDKAKVHAALGSLCSLYNGANRHDIARKFKALASLVA